MLAIAKATLHDINQVRNDLHLTKLRIDHITSRLITVESEIHVWREKVNDNTAAIIYLTAIVGHPLPES